LGKLTQSQLSLNASKREKDVNHKEPELNVCLSVAA
jgi:hypothetical protein